MWKFGWGSISVPSRATEEVDDAAEKEFKLVVESWVEQLTETLLGVSIALGRSGFEAERVRNWLLPMCIFIRTTTSDDQKDP